MRGSGGKFGLLLLPGFQSLVGEKLEGEREGEVKVFKHGRNWAHHKGEQAIDGTGRTLAVTKGAIDLCVYLHFRRTKIINSRGNCEPMSWVKIMSSYTNSLLYANMKMHMWQW